MSKARSPRLYRQPSREEYSTILFTGYELGDLFDEKQVLKFAKAAKWRVIAEFHYAMETNPRYKYGSDRRPKRRTDNYILGLKNRPSELARYVNQLTHGTFIRPYHLPAELTELSPKLVEKIIHRAQYDVILLVVQLMHNREIWYDEGVGIWQVCQSSVDELLAYKAAVKAALVKDDDRSFHGRVRSQSKNRGIPAGVSVSYS